MMTNVLVKKRLKAIRSDNDPIKLKKVLSEKNIQSTSQTLLRECSVILQTLCERSFGMFSERFEVSRLGSKKTFNECINSVFVLMF